MHVYKIIDRSLSDFKSPVVISRFTRKNFCNISKMKIVLLIYLSAFITLVCSVSNFKKIYFKIIILWAIINCFWRNAKTIAQLMRKFCWMFHVAASRKWEFLKRVTKTLKMFDWLLIFITLLFQTDIVSKNGFPRLFNPSCERSTPEYECYFACVGQYFQIVEYFFVDDCYHLY